MLGVGGDAEEAGEVEVELHDEGMSGVAGGAVGGRRGGDGRGGRRQPRGRGVVVVGVARVRPVDHGLCTLT
jgi:hypothetical protein